MRRPRPSRAPALDPARVAAIDRDMPLPLVGPRPPRAAATALAGRLLANGGEEVSVRDVSDRLPTRRTAWLATLAVAAALRLAWLAARPPHHDEGVNGFLVERML